MSIFKCKMCGGTLEFNLGDTVAVCDSCGSRQTLPRLDDDRRANLYDRANHLRRNDEFDRALAIYEQILNEDGTDAEAYWSIVLCRYGIEYVEDPATHRRVPTVNRTQFTSIFEDVNYQSALRYADEVQREIYKVEAEAINEIQKGILAISQQEEPFDVFICYKETDRSGRRTQDSVLANDLYHELTEEGFKVFFSRITLEDKLGTAYEPYIFAALNSAKVMVVIGTRPEHFNAVWVKNEWSRFLGMMKNGAKKVLVPAYRDMNPYDLPEEFSHLQAQDMSKLGFMQDLIRGIRKIAAEITSETKNNQEAAVTSKNANIMPLLKRAFMFLEDGEWGEADEYCEKVLDQDPECARAYLGKLMAELHVSTQEGLKDCEEPFNQNKNYGKVVRFADDELKAKLNGYIDAINEHNANKRLENIYSAAIGAMHAAKDGEDFKAAAGRFEKIAEYKDASFLKERCLEMAKESIYSNAVNIMNSAEDENDFESAAWNFERIAEYKDAFILKEHCLAKADDCRKDKIYRAAIGEMAGNTIGNFEWAIKQLQSIPGWKDADEKVHFCQIKIEEAKAEQERKRLESERREEQERILAIKREKRRKRFIFMAVMIVMFCIALIIVVENVIIPEYEYQEAFYALEEGDYTAAYTTFNELGDYKNSVAMVMESQYQLALKDIEEKNYLTAYNSLKELGDYKEGEAKCDEIKTFAYWEILEQSEVGDVIYYGTYDQDYDESNGKEDIEWIVLVKENNKVLVISKYGLDCQPYGAGDVTWGVCSLRYWLNETFFNDAFIKDEQAKIVPTILFNPDNYTYGTNGGDDTTDRVFLLSIDEVEKYFVSDDARKVMPTTRTKGKAINIDHMGNSWWWLRSPGDYQKCAACVLSDGTVCYSGCNVESQLIVVRPAIWIEFGE